MAVSQIMVPQYWPLVDYTLLLLRGPPHGTPTAGKPYMGTISGFLKVTGTLIHIYI